MVTVPYDKNGILDMRQTDFTKALRKMGYHVNTGWCGSDRLFFITSPDRKNTLAIRKDRIQRFRRHSNPKQGVVLVYLIGSVYFSDGKIEYWDA